MKYLVVLALLITGCTFKIDTRTDAQVEAQNRSETNQEIIKRCNKLCAPCKAVAFDPINHFCQCLIGDQ